MRKILLALCCMASVVFVARGEAPQNPRGISSATTQRAERTQSDSVSRSATITTRARTQNVNARAASTPIQQSRSAISARSASTSVVNKSSSHNKARSGSISRSATPARATTAVFSDTSKLGTGYNTCKEAYNTCMDQFCAAANDTYRRCICSDKYKDFADTEAALASAKIMLQDFSDNNLANVSMTAAEVTAMSFATAGESAATTDKTAAAAMLDEITDLLSGKTKASKATTSVLDFSNLNFNAAVDDIWSGTSSNLFDTSTQDLSTITGTDLYNKVNEQCAQIAADSCGSNATQQMVRSAYSLLISQDCQAYSKSIDAQKEQVSQKVREASKLLRDARLEEYRSHNSESVNECIAAVRNDVLNDSACGENFVRCLDFTGLYIDAVTGDPIYSPRLFQLSSQIKLENINASENKVFLAGLDSFKNRATASLNNCRDDATTVWDAFKKQALIEIAQAQDRKIQEIKDECVNTMKECYDSTNDALESFDDTSSKRTTAISARATAAMCKDKVVACAALYTPSDGVECKFDSDNKITNADKCGLRELMNFVSSVDTVKIAEGCETALESYIEETCAPAVGDTEHESPYGCRLISPEKLLANLQTYAKNFCIGDSEAVLDSDTQDSVNKIMQEVRAQLGMLLQQSCQNSDGRWISNPEDVQGMSSISLDPNFLSNIYGGLNNFKQTVDSSYNLVAAVITTASSSGATDSGRSAVLVPRTAVTSSGVSAAQEQFSTAPTTITGGTTSSTAPTATSITNSITSANLSVSSPAQKTNGLLTSSPSSTSLTSITGSTANSSSSAITTTAPAVVYKPIGWGLCTYNSVASMCSRQNELTGSQGYAVYNSGTNTCDLSSGWYQARCESIGTSGYWDATSRRCYW